MTRAMVSFSSVTAVFSSRLSPLYVWQKLVAVASLGRLEVAGLLGVGGRVGVLPASTIPPIPSVYLGWGDYSLAIHCQYHIIHSSLSSLEMPDHLTTFSR